MRGALLLLLAACDDPCKRGSEPTFELGVGATTFTQVSDGDDAHLVFGPQGGYHIDLAVKTTYLDLDDLFAGTIEGVVDGSRHFYATPWFAAECIDDTQIATGVRMFLETTPEEVIGHTVIVDAEISDIHGTSLADGFSLTVQAPL